MSQFERLPVVRTKGWHTEERQEILKRMWMDHEKKEILQELEKVAGPALPNWATISSFATGKLDLRKRYWNAKLGRTIKHKKEVAKRQADRKERKRNEAMFSNKDEV